MATTVQLDDDQRGRKIVSIGGQSFVLDELVGAKGVEPGVVEVFKCAKGRSQTAARKLHSVKVKTPGQQADDVVRDIKSLLPPPPQDVVVFVNPTSGDGRGPKVFEASVRPMLEAAAIKFEMIKTTRPLEALEYCRDLEERKDLIMIVGGDGSVSEVVRGLYQGGTFFGDIPLSHIPAGSGNALACSIAHFCKDNASATDAAFYAVKGRTHSLDVTKYELDDGVVFPSFLSLTWAVIADVDLGSESLRCLGSFRFDLAAVYRILCLRKHKGTIAYVPLDEEDDAAEWVRMPEDANYHLAVAVNLSHIGPSTHIAPEARLDDGAIHLIWTSGDTSMSTKMDLFDGFLKIEKGTHVDKPNFHVAKCKKIRLKPAQGDTSRISIDGEEVPNKPIVGTVVPRCLRVFVSPETALAAAPPAPAP